MKELKKASPATYHVIASSGDSKRERFDNLRQQYVAKLEAQKKTLQESERRVQAAYGEVACG